MGVVYRGTQDYVDRPVAVKVLFTSGLVAPHFADRFRREATMLSSLQHPHIVTCFQAGVTEQKLCFLVMELMEGPDLLQHVTANGPLTPTTTLELGRDVARALSYAWDQGIIHRDVKPENVLLKPKHDAKADDAFPFLPKLADLGLARPRYDESNLTASNVAVGTPVTMAPEQVLWPDRVDFRADIYGLGCVLFHMLTGRAAFVDGTPSQILVRKATGETPDFAALPPGAPDPLRALLSRMLAPTPEARYGSYKDLIDAMDQLLAQSSAVSVALPADKVRAVVAAVSAAHAKPDSSPKQPETIASSIPFSQPTPIAPPVVSTAAASTAAAPSRQAPTGPRRVAPLVGLASACLVVGFILGWASRSPSDPSATPARAGSQAAAVPTIDRAAERKAVIELGQLLRSKSTPDGGFDNELSPITSAWGCGQGIRALALIDDASHARVLERLLEALPGLALRDADGALRGYPFVAGIDTIACLEPTAEVGMALALTKGRLQGDSLPLGHAVFDFLLRTQNPDGSFPTLPILGAKASRPSATAMALHALVPLGRALEREDEALTAGERSAVWLTTLFARPPADRGTGSHPEAPYFEVNPARRFGIERSIPGLNERAILAMLELRSLARDLEHPLAPAIGETVSSWARDAPLPCPYAPTRIGVPRSEDYLFIHELTPGQRTAMSNCRWVVFPWRLLVSHALARDPETPRRAEWAADAQRLRALIPELPDRFRDADTWQVADLLYGVAVVASVEPGADAPFALELVKAP
jgi:serine/threonine protein kinase